MANLVVDEAKLDATIGVLAKAVSIDVNAVCEPIAVTLKEADQTDAVAQSCLEGMKKFQAQHNVAIKAAEKVIEQFRQLDVLKEYFKKLDANRVENADADFQVRKKLDPSQLC